MGTPNWLALLPAFTSRLFYELDRYRAKSQQSETQEKLNDIKEDPDSYHAERFGDSSGRVSIKHTDPSDIDK